MKNVLIINLKRFGDVFTTGHLVNSYMAENPNNKVSLLVFKEFERAAKNIANVETVFTIDREKFLTFTKNQIFSNSYALENFFNELSEVKQKEWDIVFNYSNDRVSTHLTSHFSNSTNETIGVSFDDTCSIEYSSEWDIIFNDVLTSYKNTPMSFTDVYHKMANLSHADRGIVLRTDESHNKSAAKNFNQIRENESIDGTNVKIIAIQVSASNKRKEVKQNTIIKLIDLISSDKRFVPVLILAPTEVEREKVKAINSEFNNTLISIEADFLALNSVLMHVDLLITPDTSVKHVADLLNTPTIELSKGESPFLKQGVTNEDSLIITRNINERSFTIKEAKEAYESGAIETFNANDIFLATKYLLEGEEVFATDLTENTTIYYPRRDKLGVRYSYLTGDYNTAMEVNRLISRQFINNFFGLGDSVDIYQEASGFDSELTSSWISEEKDVLTDFTKHLLGTLRTLLQGIEQNRMDFINNLGNLLSYCENDNVSSIPAIIFRARLETLNTQNFSESSREIEGLLYELKGDLQKLHKTIKGFEEHRFNKGKEERMSSRREASL